MKKKILFTASLMLFAITFAFCVNASAVSMPASDSSNSNLKGIDLSEWQAGCTINWSTLKNNVSVIYIRASIKNKEGILATDKIYDTFAAKSQSYGISHGFYHFFRPSTDLSKAREQADFFYNAIKNYGYDCVPMLDVESTTEYDGGAELSKSQVTAAVQAFASEFKAKSGRDIMIYTYNYFIDSYFDTSLSKYKLWVANWTKSGPFITSVWDSWDMWQYSDGISVGGISETVDGDLATSNVFLSEPTGITWIDYPKITSGFGDVTVKGWAISHYGVSRVDVYVDSTKVGSVYKNNFTARPDVENAFSGGGFEDALNSGYSYTIPYSRLSNGTHNIKVAGIDDRGNTVYAAAKTYTCKRPGDAVNISSPSGSYTGTVTVSGWAISSYGVRRVDIYLDGTGIGSVANSGMTARPDIESQFSNIGYTDLEHSGFSYTIPDSRLPGGTHTVSAALIDNSGRKIWTVSKTFTAVRPADRVYLDKPAGTYRGNVTVSGWAISCCGICRTDIYLDGKGIGSVHNGDLTSRSDILSTYGGMGYSDLEHSGFSFTIPNSRLPGGTHTVCVKSFNKSGRAVWSQTKTFTAVRPADRVYLDKPAGTYRGNVTVSGWAISCCGICRTDIYLDGKGIGSVHNSDLTSRSDILSTYGGMGYSDLEHSGFSFTIPNSRLPGGTHTVCVKSFNKSGRAVWSQTKTFTAVRPADRVYLDKPAGTYRGNVTVSGWAISCCGICRTDIYLDGRKIGSVHSSSFKTRSDIVSIFGSKGYNYLDRSGFSYTIARSRLSRGAHSVRVLSYNRSGKAIYSMRKIFKVE